ncbi:MAG TPA: TetR/AcrR family transcriptional regulator [Streptosporangiaceae bacterium]
MAVVTDDPARERILQAADELFYARGVQAVSMDQIRDRAGVPLKRIYAAFPSKNDLVDAYLNRRDEQLRDAIETWVTRRSDDPREQLLLVFDALHRWTRSQPQFRGCAFHNAIGELGGTSAAAAAIVRSNKHHLRAFLERTARRAGLRRPDEVAFQLMLLAEGALVTAAVDDDPDVPARAKAAAQLLLEAAAR